MKKLVIASITAFLLSSPIVSNAASCKNIKFAVNNKTGATIKLLKVQFRNVSTGKTKTENFPDLTCAANVICRVTTGQNLRNARNDQLNNFEFTYKYLIPETGQWSDTYRTIEFPVNNAVCIANRTYGGGHWKVEPFPIINW